MTDLATTEHQASTGRGGAAGGAGRTTGRTEQEDQLEGHRIELTGYCYRMLGSAFDAEDAVQETMVRAWRALDRFDGDALRPWLYRIATNVCLTMLGRRQHRAQPLDLGPGSTASPGPLRRRSAGGTGTGTGTTVWPVPDGLVLPDDVADPADLTVARETIRLAFVTALQHLRPRQRAVLILRDVLRWRSREVADLLDTSTASVNSTLQRARAVLTAFGGDRPGDGGPATRATPDLPDDEQRHLLDRYVTAFERFDMESLVTLLHADATMDMPPRPLVLHGRLDICRFLLEEGGSCQGTLLVPTVAANGAPAFGAYRPTGPGGGYVPFAVHVVEVAGSRIEAVHVFADPRLFTLFGLPTEPPQTMAA